MMFRQKTNKKIRVMTFIASILLGTASDGLAFSCKTGKVSAEPKQETPKKESTSANPKTEKASLPKMPEPKSDHQQGPIDINQGFSAIAERVVPAVVNVSTTQVVEGRLSERGDVPRFAPGSPFEEFFREFFDQMDKPRRVQSLGSGFIISADGKTALIVTNNHVIQDARKVSIFLHDNTELEATVVATDERTDLALLKVNTEKLPEGQRVLPTVEWGDSTVAKVGDWVVAVGNPFGLGSTVTAGIISNRARDIANRSHSRVSEFVDDFLQHSAPINVGNSGGPLFNLHGKVVGINTAIYSPTGGNVGIGFAIPSEVAKETIRQLMEYGRTKRGWLGVRIQHVTDAIAESLGLGKTRGAIVVGSVTPDGPASKADIKPGDIIIEFDGKELNEKARLSRLVAETPVGKKAKVKIWRNGQIVEKDIVLGEFESAQEKGMIPSEKGKAIPDGKESVEVLGMHIGSITPERKERYNIRKETKGAIILKIDRNSIAEEAQLVPGDVIVEVNQKELAGPQEFVKTVAEAKQNNKKYILLLVERNGDQHFRTLKLEAEFKEEGQKKENGPKHKRQ